MLNLLPQPDPKRPRSMPRRCRGWRASAMPFAGRRRLCAGPDAGSRRSVAERWDERQRGKQRWFDRRSRLVGTTATGIEALLSQREGREPHALPARRWSMRSAANCARSRTSSSTRPGLAPWALPGRRPTRSSCHRTAGLHHYRQMRGEDQAVGGYARTAGRDERPLLNARFSEGPPDLVGRPEPPVLAVERRERHVAGARDMAGGDARTRVGLSPFEPRLATRVDQRQAGTRKQLLLGDNFLSRRGLEARCRAPARRAPPGGSRCAISGSRRRGSRPYRRRSGGA